METGYLNYVSLMPNGILRQANLKMLFERAKQYENASFKGLFNFISFKDSFVNNLIYFLLQLFSHHLISKFYQHILLFPCCELS